MASIEIVAPSTGSVIDVFISVGQHVAALEELLIIESMKMEIPVVSESPGTVEEVLVKANDPLTTATLLCGSSRTEFELTQSRCHP